MNELNLQSPRTTTPSEEMAANYKSAVEKAIAHLPVKNGVINIDAIWVATSLPFEILLEVLRQDALVLPTNVDRINLKSNVRSKKPGRPNRRRRRRKSKAKG